MDFALTIFLLFFSFFFFFFNENSPKAVIVKKVSVNKNWWRDFELDNSIGHVFKNFKFATLNGEFVRKANDR